MTTPDAAIRTYRKGASISDKDALVLEDFKVYYGTPRGTVKAVDDVSFYINHGETLGLVGESGCGKTVTALSILQLIRPPKGKIVSGQITYYYPDGRRVEITSLKPNSKEMRKIRGNKISMIFQEPMTSLNPVFTIGNQIMEAITLHQNLDKKRAYVKTIEMLELVGIPSPEQRYNEYPHQLSGGMRQRVMIAMALSCEPEVSIADEPTTALDVTIQAQILDLMKKIQKERTRSSILLITHDLSVIAETCHRVIVMYGGKIQEIAPVNLLFRKPLHPYTKGLLRSIPSVENKGLRLKTIVGNVPSFQNFPKGCKFADRCPEVVDDCHTIEPNLKQIKSEQWVRCPLADESMK